MRIDVITIFPDYLAPLRLSLVGKAIEAGLLDARLHDLREWSHDRHRRVDDTPYGGGAGMVMRPEPWGQALDALVTDASRVAILTPSGRRFDQALAAELAAESHLVLACGRYEGIDARVAAYARTRMRVDEISIGDYVLNGGEAAALVVIEAVARLLPGVIGNPESLAEESHSSANQGLLEYPVYTKPATWRGLDVPEILLSGHHGRIAGWRLEQARALTGQRRPDLLGPRGADLVIRAAVPADAGELLTVQRAAFVTEAQLNDAPHIPPLTETLEDVVHAIRTTVTLVARDRGRLVGGVRGERDGTAWLIGRLATAPDVQGSGVGSRLLAEIEAAAPDDARLLRLVTGARSVPSHGFYTRRGYRAVGHTRIGSSPDLLVLERPLPSRSVESD
jgi:tRNA (guanine37-N1)-methyltransferase